MAAQLVVPAFVEIADAFGPCKFRLLLLFGARRERNESGGLSRFYEASATVSQTTLLLVNRAGSATCPISSKDLQCRNGTRSFRLCHKEMRINVITAKMRQPLYPWLLAIYPILHLYAKNIGLVKDGEVLGTVLFMLAATTIAYVFAGAILDSRHKAALVISVLGLIFALSGHIHELALPEASVLLWTAGVALLGALLTKRLLAKASPRILLSSAPWLNLIAFLLVLAQIFPVVIHHGESESQYRSWWRDSRMAQQRATISNAMDSESRPDIYYIIPDAYPSDIWHREAMSYDNDRFTQALKDRGFVINQSAQSNYASTLLSLASTLNMTYINSNPSDFAGKAYLRVLIADNQVARTLTQLGYTYVQFLSGFLVPSPIASINRDFTPAGSMDIDELQLVSHGHDLERAFGVDAHSISAFYKRSFVALYLDTTLLKIFAQKLHSALFSDPSTPYSAKAPERFLDTLEELDSIIAMPEATFTMVHLFKPHIPTTFDEQGNLIEATKRPTPDEYFAELRFINAKFLETIDRILEGSQHGPIIVFQSDHGSTYGNHTRHSRRIHFDAYSAYYVPATYSFDVPQPHTLINTFPLIINAVFDAGLELRDNRLFERLVDNGVKFEQKNVTESYARWMD